jgi:hypothetical protein
MKPKTLAIISLIVTAACNKSNSGSNGNQIQWIDSVKLYTITPSGTSFTKTSFTYDGSNRLISAMENSNDTNSAHVASTTSSVITFSYNGSDTIPNAYSDNIHHLLFYDGQGRVLLDSQDVGGAPKFVDHYSYGSGYIARFRGTSLDTVFTDGKNKTGYITYQATLSGGNIVKGNLTYNEGYYYSIYTNPFYFGRLASHIGYLFQPSFFDMASREICTSRQYILNAGDPNTIINYTWTTNSSQQVVSGIGTNAGTGLPVEFYTFFYRNTK